MIYTQIVWALVIDRALFQTKINGWAILGTATIMGSLFVVNVAGESRRFGGSTSTHLASEEDENAGSVSLDEIQTE